MYNKARPPGPQAAFGLSRLTKKNNHVLRMVSCHPKKSDPHPTCWVSLLLVRLFCRRFALANGSSWHGGTHGSRTFQVNCADGIFPPNFWRPGKNNSCIYPTKKNASTEQWICTKKTWLFPKHRKKSLTIVPRTVFSREKLHGLRLHH